MRPPFLISNLQSNALKQHNGPLSLLAKAFDFSSIFKLNPGEGRKFQLRRQEKRMEIDEIRAKIVQETTVFLIML